MDENSPPLSLSPAKLTAAETALKIIRQSNTISRGGTGISLVTEKGYRFLVAVAQEQRKKDPQRYKFEVSSGDVAAFLAMEPFQFVDEMKKLVHCTIDWEPISARRDGRRRYGICAMLGDIVYEAAKQKLTFSFPASLLNEVIDPEYFRNIPLETIQRFNGKYALKLYEYCNSCLNPKKTSGVSEWLPLDSLAKLLKAEDVYDRPDNFEARAIKGPLEEANRRTDLTITVRKRGRGKSAEYQFQFSKIEKKFLPFKWLPARDRSPFVHWVRRTFASSADATWNSLAYTDHGLQALNLWQREKNLPPEAMELIPEWGKRSSMAQN